MSARILSLSISIFSFLASAKLALAAVKPVQNNSDGFAGLDQLTSVFANVASVVSALIGFALLIMLIRGGVAYITAQGDPKAIASARSTITWAIIGFIVVLASFLIIALISGVLGVDITKFTI